MAWCRQATSHYLSQCWPRSMSPYDVTRQQRVNCVTSWCASTPYNMLWGDVCRECMHINKSQKRCKSSTYSIAHHCGRRRSPPPPPHHPHHHHCNWPSSQIPEFTCSISHKCSIQNRNVHISVLNGTLWDMERIEMHSGICEISLFRNRVKSPYNLLIFIQSSNLLVKSFSVTQTIINLSLQCFCSAHVSLIVFPELHRELHSGSP